MMGFVNETRGLAIVGTAFTYLSEGAYAIVFLDSAAGKVVKAFKRRPNLDHVGAVFRAETDAYGLARSSAEVSVLIPRNFRICNLGRVTDRHGQDVTDEFLPDFAFETDFVQGCFHKIGGIGGTNASRVHQLFHEAGIRHTIDMSVTVNADGIIVKAIDFATEEHELMHDE